MISRNLPDLWRGAGSSLLSPDWNPFQELHLMQNQLNRLFEGVARGSDLFPMSYDMEETDSHYLMSCDLPGARKEDIRIHLQNGELTISAERREEREERSRGRFQAGRFQGSFQRVFMISPDVKPEQIETEYKDGVLRIAVPKTEASKAQVIKVGEGKPGFWEKLLSHRKEESRKAA